MTSTGLPREGASSWMPPESVRIQVAPAHEVVEVNDLEWVDDAQPVEPVEFLVGGPAHLGIHMDGVDRLRVRPLLHDAPYSPEHVVHGLAEVLPTVGCDEDEAGVPGHSSSGWEYPSLTVVLKASMPVLPVTKMRSAGFPSLKRFFRDASVGAKYQLEMTSTTWRFWLREEQHPVSPQAGLHMPYGNLEVEGGERRGKRGRSVAVHEHHVGALVFQHLSDPPAARRLRRNEEKSCPGLMMCRS